LTIEECVKGAMEAVLEKESAFSEKDVMERALKTAVGHYRLDQLLEELHRQKDVEYIGTIDRFGREYYTTEAMRETERGILDFVERGKGQSKTAISKEVMETRLKATGMTLSAGQREAVEMVCTSKDVVSFIQGDAGAGKTYAMKCDKEIMAAEGFTVRGFAPTGVAALELTDAGVDAVTIDMFLVDTRLQDAAKPGEIWIVDESGMVGSRKLERFLDIAAQKGAKVVLVGDEKQFQSVDQGKMFSILQEKSNADKTEITEVKRQKTEHMIAAVTAIKDKDFLRANEYLKKNDSIQEILDGDKRIDYMRNEYINDEKNGIESVILTATNAVREKLNELIRADRAALGKVTGGGEFDTYVKTGGDLDMRLANSYTVGQKVIIKQDCGNIPKGTEAEVESINLKDNTIKLKYHNEEVKVKDQCGKYDVYDVKKRDFGVGDRVIFMKNDHRIGVANGQTGIIQDIQADGTATIVVGKIKHKQKEVKCNLNNGGSNPYNYLDLAYCITNHKSQGSSYDKVIINADISKQRTNYNAFYVQATRARNDIRIVTNDERQLFIQAKEAQNKLSTLDFGNTVKTMREDMIDDRINQLNEERKKREKYIKEMEKLQKEREAREAQYEEDCFKKYANTGVQYKIGEYVQENLVYPNGSPVSPIPSDQMNDWIKKENIGFIESQTPSIIKILHSKGNNIDIASISKERDSTGEAIYSTTYTNPNNKEDIQRLENKDLDSLCERLMTLSIRDVRQKVLDHEMPFLGR
jgi:ATP-dependent exoDNAse (exonuclease V) alpha subunit